MAGRIETDQDTSSSQVGETPVPASRGTGSIVSGHEGLMSRPETPGLGGTDGQPDQVQEEVQHDKAGRDPEDILEVARRQKVQQSSQGQHDFGTDPLNGAELDIGGLRWEVDTEHGDLRKHVVDSTLCVHGTESRPGCGTPPGHDETEQPAEAGTASFGSPEIDGSSRGRCRTHFRDDRSRDEGEDHGDQVAGPVGQVTASRDTCAEGDTHSTDEVQGSCKALAGGRVKGHSTHQTSWQSSQTKCTSDGEPVVVRLTITQITTPSEPNHTGL